MSLVSPLGADRAGVSGARECMSTSGVAGSGPEGSFPEDPRDRLGMSRARAFFASIERSFMGLLFEDSSLRMARSSGTAGFPIFFGEDRSSFVLFDASGLRSTLAPDLAEALSLASFLFADNSLKLLRFLSSRIGITLSAAVLLSVPVFAALVFSSPSLVPNFLLELAREGG